MSKTSIAKYSPEKLKIQIFPKVKYWRGPYISSRYGRAIKITFTVNSGGECMPVLSPSLSKTATGNDINGNPQFSHVKNGRGPYLCRLCRKSKITFIFDSAGELMLV